MQIIEYKTISMRITDAFDIVDSNGETDQRNLNHTKKFDYVINIYVKAGWQPLGAPFVILDSRWQQINQTMVKYEESLEYVESIFRSADEMLDDISE